MYSGLEIANMAVAKVSTRRLILPAMMPFSDTTSLDIIDERLKIIELAVVSAAARILNDTMRHIGRGRKARSVGVTLSLSKICGNLLFSVKSLSSSPRMVTRNVYKSPNKPNKTTILFKALSFFGINKR